MTTFHFMSIKDVITCTGLSKSSIYRLMNDKLFPRSVYLSPRRIAWDSREVIAWMEMKKRGEWDWSVYECKPLI